MSNIMKMLDERETQKKPKKQRQKRTRGSFSERVRAKWFCCAFMLGFLQLIYKASLIFKSNLELASSIILKERIIRVKACCGGVYLLKNMRLVIFFDMFLNPSFKMTTSFVNIARTTVSIFINLPNLRNKIICVYTFWLHASYWNVIKLYLKEDCFQYFSIRLFYHLCFVFHCVFTFYHCPPRFHD